MPDTNITGTLSTDFQLDSSSNGPHLANSLGNLDVRTADNSARADIKCKNILVDGSITGAGALGLAGPSQSLYQMNPPNVNAFAWTNQGTATVTSNSRFMAMVCNDTSGVQVRILDQPIPNPASDFTLTAVLTLDNAIAQWSMAGLVLRDSSNGKFTSFGPSTATDGRIQVTHWTDTSTASTYPLDTAGMPQVRGRTFWRINKSGSTVYFQYSMSGVNFITVYSTTWTSFTSAYDHIGIMMYMSNGVSPSTLTCESWTYGDLTVAAPIAPPYIYEFNRSDTYANLPAAGTAGRLYFPTDAPFMFRDNGSAWIRYYQGQRCDEPPAVASFTVLNAGANVVTKTNGVLTIYNPTDSGGGVFHGLSKAAPSTPWTMTFRFNYIWDTSNNGYPSCFMVGFRDSSSGKLDVMALQNQNAGPQYWQHDTYTNPTTRNAYDNTYPFVNWGYKNIEWMRIGDTGTNQTWDFSFDGVTWISLKSQSRTTWTAAPDHYCFGVNPYSGKALNLSIYGMNQG